MLGRRESAGVKLKMAWVTQRKISGILTILTALLTLAIADGDTILQDTKQGRKLCIKFYKLLKMLRSEVKA